MFSALSLLTWWLLLRALRLRRRPATGSGTAWWRRAMLLTHPFAPLVLVVQAAFVGVVFWRGARPPDGACVVQRLRARGA